MVPKHLSRQWLSTADRRLSLSEGQRHLWLLSVLLPKQWQQQRMVTAAMNVTLRCSFCRSFQQHRPHAHKKKQHSSQGHSIQYAVLGGRETRVGRGKHYIQKEEKGGWSQMHSNMLHLGSLWTRKQAGKNKRQENTNATVYLPCLPCLFWNQHLLLLLPKSTGSKRKAFL